MKTNWSASSPPRTRSTAAVRPTPPRPTPPRRGTAAGTIPTPPLRAVAGLPPHIPPPTTSALAFDEELDGGVYEEELDLRDRFGGGWLRKASDEVDEFTSHPYSADLGTISEPYLVFINDLTATTASKGFTAFVNDNIERNNKSYSAMVIRLSIFPLDVRKWSATLPTRHQVHVHLLGRCILVRGPAIDCWQRRDPDEFVKGKRGKQLEEGNFKQRLQEAEAARPKEPEEMSYYLLVLPVGTEFDNTVFSDDEITVKRDVVDLCHKQEGSNKKDILGMVSTWRIALKGSGKQIKAPARELDLADYEF